MPSVKISSKVESGVWQELKLLARESRQSISGLLTEAIRRYVRELRPGAGVQRHLESVLPGCDELARLLAE